MHHSELFAVTFSVKPAPPPPEIQEQSLQGPSDLSECAFTVKSFRLACSHFPKGRDHSTYLFIETNSRNVSSETMFYLLAACHYDLLLLETFVVGRKRKKKKQTTKNAFVVLKKRSQVVLWQRTRYWRKPLERSSGLHKKDKYFNIFLKFWST